MNHPAGRIYRRVFRIKNNKVKKKLDGVDIYTGFMILGGVILSIFSIFWLLATFSVPILIIFSFSLSGIVLAIGLRRFKKLAWIANMLWLSILTFFIVVGLIMLVLDVSTTLFLSIAPLWLIYFYKKRKYFNNKKFMEAVDENS